MPDLSTTMIEFTPWDAEIPTVPADQATVEAMLVLHRLWVDEQPGGVQANFSHMNISGLELQNRMLDYAIFYGTNASNTNFKASSLIGDNDNAQPELYWLGTIYITKVLRVLATSHARKLEN